MPFIFRRFATVALASLLLVSIPAMANVVLEGTRLIYPAQAGDVSMRVLNQGAQPMLLQAWIDSRSDKSTPGEANAPFVLTPAVARIEPNGSQMLRIFSMANTLPQEQESVFYLSVLAVPPKPVSPEENSMQIGVRSTIKVFYRPAKLPGKANAAHGSLVWTRVRVGDTYALQAYNPTAYHVSFANFRMRLGDKDIRDAGGGMVAPGATQVFQLPLLGKHLGTPVSLRYTMIDDWGELKEFPLPLSQ